MHSLCVRGSSTELSNDDNTTPSAKQRPETPTVQGTLAENVRWWGAQVRSVGLRCRCRPCAVEALGFDEKRKTGWLADGNNNGNAARACSPVGVSCVTTDELVECFDIRNLNTCNYVFYVE